MGALCNGKPKRYEHEEFKKRFKKYWEKSQFFQMQVSDFYRVHGNFIEKKRKQGAENFDEIEFINHIPFIDDFNKRIFVHLHKICFEDLNESMTGEFPDVIREFFIFFVINLLSNPNMPNNKMQLANFIDAYLQIAKYEDFKKGVQGMVERTIQQEIPKQNSKQVDQDETSHRKVDAPIQQNQNPQDNQQIPEQEKPNDIPKDVGNPNDQSRPPPSKNLAKKKLMRKELTKAIMFLVKFCFYTIRYFVGNWVFIWDSMRTPNMFEFDIQKMKNNDVIHDTYYGHLFYTNFKMVNKDFSQNHLEDIWVHFILEPLNRLERDVDNNTMVGTDEIHALKERFIFMLHPDNFVESMLNNKIMLPEINK